jgi:hypothetical protein
VKDELKIGSIYNITHCRKGSFTIKVTDMDNTIMKDAVWVTGLITEGRTTTMMEYNQKTVGEEQPMRISFLTKIEEVK